MRETTDIFDFQNSDGENGPFSLLEARTATLYGGLWSPYGEALFWQSVDLFKKRWLANGEDPAFFKGKLCLDVGCGGGRYSCAMALMGAKEVVGIDISAAGLSDARKRAESKNISQVRFLHASVLDLPFPDREFDFVCCSGVLHHTLSIEKGLKEIHRVLKPGGSVYLLLYGAGGIFWPLIYLLRPLAALIGEQDVGIAIENAGFPPNKRRSLLDDLFVPILETYSAERVKQLLIESGFSKWRKWNYARMDHEQDASSLIAEIESRTRVWQLGASSDPTKAAILIHCANLCTSVTAMARDLDEHRHAGRISEVELQRALVGEGHHRMIAERI